MLAEELDYEDVQKYTLVIGAQDKGHPRLSSNLTVNLEVQDVNDNPPVFDKTTYTVSVLESLPANSQFLQVSFQHYEVLLAKLRPYLPYFFY